MRHVQRRQDWRSITAVGTTSLSRTRDGFLPYRLSGRRTSADRSPWNVQGGRYREGRRASGISIERPLGCPHRTHGNRRASAVRPARRLQKILSRVRSGHAYAELVGHELSGNDPRRSPGRSLPSPGRLLGGIPCEGMAAPTIRLQRTRELLRAEGDGSPPASAGYRLYTKAIADGGVHVCGPCEEPRAGTGAPHRVPPSDSRIADLGGRRGSVLLRGGPGSTYAPEMTGKKVSSRATSSQGIADDRRG